MKKITIVAITITFLSIIIAFLLNIYLFQYSSNSVGFRRQKNIRLIDTKQEKELVLQALIDGDLGNEKNYDFENRNDLYIFNDNGKLAIDSVYGEYILILEKTEERKSINDWDAILFPPPELLMEIDSIWKLFGSRFSGEFNQYKVSLNDFIGPGMRSPYIHYDKNEIDIIFELIMPMDEGIPYIVTATHFNQPNVQEKLDLYYKAYSKDENTE